MQCHAVPCSANGSRCARKTSAGRHTTPYASVHLHASRGALYFLAVRRRRLRLPLPRALPLRAAASPLRALRRYYSLSCAACPRGFPVWHACLALPAPCLQLQLSTSQSPTSAAATQRRASRQPLALSRPQACRPRPYTLPTLNDTFELFKKEISFSFVRSHPQSACCRDSVEIDLGPCRTTSWRSTLYAVLGYQIGRWQPNRCN
jgi:hypothetical protein